MVRAVDEAAGGAAGLLRRTVGDAGADFVPEDIPADDAGDVFEVESVGPRVVLRGSSPVAQAAALRWYLTRVCGRDVSWDTQPPVEMPARLPAVRRTRRATPLRYRYCFNYCTFAYTMAFWDWPRWEREIDRMALHGVNLPLAITGQEAVWQSVYRRMGMDDVTIRAFLGGPAYLPFTWMGCTEQWGGPLPQAWIDDHAELGRRIVARERELGMTPVLQAFAGHVPEELADGHRLRWFEFETRLLDPRDPAFGRIGREFLDEQTRVFGTAHVYAADPFIEMTPPVDDPGGLARVARAVHEPMVAADPQAVWVMQSWPFAYRQRFWTPERVRAFLDAVPDTHMLVLDLWGEHRPLWRETDAFHGKPWVWCMLHDFGGRPGMHGKPARVATELADAMADPGRGRMRGAGLTMEVTGDDPAVYARWADLLWEREPTDSRAWAAGHAARRAGRHEPAAERAWSLLLDTVYSARDTGSPPPSVVTSRPRLDSGLEPAAPPHPGARQPAWDPRDLVAAWRLLLDTARAVGGDGPCGRDLVDVAAQALDLRARTLHGEIAAAYRAGDPGALARASEAFLGLLADLDTLLDTRAEYTLDGWLDAARSWGRTAGEERLHEWNARRLVTVWGRPGSRLHDYAGRHWSGLVGGYYLPRWRMWTEHLAAALTSGALDPAAFDRALGAWEEEWCRSRERYNAPDRSDTLAVASRLLERYAADF